MKIDGRLIAEHLKEKLHSSISQLPSSPHLAVVLAGKDPSSLSYVGQKVKVGKEIGAQVVIFPFPENVLAHKVFTLIEKLNTDSTITGIIIQRPLPIDVDREKLNKAVTASKDVDGFHPDSKFTPPVACAIIKILQWVYHNETMKPPASEHFYPWLSHKKILVIGRGETAGRPIVNYLIKNNFHVTIAHSKTENSDQLCLQSDIIISCVGRSHIVRPRMVTMKTTLIGVGMHPENDTFVADYNQEEIATKVAYYTPVPGGVGPVNVACLFENLVKASQLK